MHDGSISVNGGTFLEGWAKKSKSVCQGPVLLIGFKDGLIIKNDDQGSPTNGGLRLSRRYRVDARATDIAKNARAAGLKVDDRLIAARSVSLDLQAWRLGRFPRVPRLDRKCSGAQSIRVFGEVGSAGPFSISRLGGSRTAFPGALSEMT